METRIEKDSMGEMRVPADCYWGSQTQRSLENFPVGTERMPPEVIRAMVIIKKAAARANASLNGVDDDLASRIDEVCDEILAGGYEDQFPLSVWQTGSGTQTNMNVNEVIANRCNELAGRERGSKAPIHPNDHVNRSQSSNDTFPCAMHISAYLQGRDVLIPGLKVLQQSLQTKIERYQTWIKIGRTHMMDATPVTLGHELNSWLDQLEEAEKSITQRMEALLTLPLGGTAVGTGLNAPVGFAERAVQEIAAITHVPFTSTARPSALMAAHDQLVAYSSSLRHLAVALTKIGNDIRLLASGPRCGLGEWRLPANEPGSSIMPGKVNPTQVEMLTQVCVQVMGNDVTVGMAGASGQLQLNVMKPVIIHSVLQSARLLGDACDGFARRCVDGMEPDRMAIETHLERSLMLVTALNPLIGYDQAAAVAKKAYAEGRTLREVVLELQLLDEDAVDQALNPEKMV